MAIQCCRIEGMARCGLDATLEIWPAPEMDDIVYSCDGHVGDVIPDHPVVVAPIGEASETDVKRLLEARR